MEKELRMEKTAKTEKANRAFYDKKQVKI
jgi:hypothetical protein